MIFNFNSEVFISQIIYIKVTKKKVRLTKSKPTIIRIVFTCFFYFKSFISSINCFSQSSLVCPPLYFFNVCLRSEEHTSELQSRPHLVCRLLLEKKNFLMNILLIQKH